jgi:hypothetical protein
MGNLVPYSAGLLVLLLVCVLCKLKGGTWNPLIVARGEDGRLSTSKFQFWLWTLVILFVYAALYAERAGRGYFAAIDEIPRNLLLAMGFSVTTAAAAKGITVSYIKTGQIIKDKADPATGGPGGLFQDDKGSPDLSKIQMMAWTSIAIGIYLVTLLHLISFTPITEVKQLQLPDIDGALMVLMGLGQGAYLGQKLAATSSPRLTGLSPGGARAATVITLAGQGLGNQQNGNQVTIDGVPIVGGTITTWNDTQIVFPLPAAHPSGTAWATGQRVSVGVIVSGQCSVNQFPLALL